jgi:aspartate-semialdehyde dehydrogenase
VEKVRVGLLGCTGIVGQVFVWMLSDHDWFELSFISASPSRSGQLYGDEVRWMLPFQMPERIRCREIETLDYSRLRELGIRIVFSALPSEIAKTMEPRLRENGFWVFSNASAMRYDDDVPVLVPEVNLDSMDLIRKQGFPDGGFIITNANCTTTGLAVVLAPLRKFGIEEVYVSTYQSVSGAGYPGLPALDILGNTIPFIRDEETKLIVELRKILGLDAGIYPHCVRVPTFIGHLETVWVKLEKSVKEEEVVEAWKTFGPEGLEIPSLPQNPIIYRETDDFPQTKMSLLGAPPGMPVYTGRLRKENDKIGFVLLVNNLVKGAAGGSIQNAEAFLYRYRDRI